MPQWDFLDFLADHGKRYPNFDLRMRAEVTGLIEEGGRVVGVRAKTPEGDSRSAPTSWSAATGGIRRCARARASTVEDIGAPMDVLWFRVSRRASDTAETFGHMEAGRMLVMLNRGDYWQCAYVIPKGGIDEVKAKGLDGVSRQRRRSCRRSCATASARSRAGTTSSC